MAQNVTCQVRAKELRTRQDSSQVVSLVAKYVGTDPDIDGFIVRYNVAPGSALDLAYAVGDYISVTLDVGASP